MRDEQARRRQHGHLAECAQISSIARCTPTGCITLCLILPLHLQSQAAGQQVLLLKATREAHMVKVCPVIQLIFSRLLLSAAARGTIYYSAHFELCTVLTSAQA